MIIYISGPMRGKPDFNFDTFNAAEKALQNWAVKSGPDEGCTILNPARNFGGDKTRQVAEYMQLDLEQVLRADALVLLPGWEASEGSKLEVQVARATGKDFWEAWLNEDHWVFDPIDAPKADQSPRAASLERARSYITGDRNAAYGSPISDFTRTAAAWTAYGYRAPGGRDLRAHDVALMMIMLKASRLMWSPERQDSWDDIAGYAACGHECVVLGDGD